ncbi:hypothetical protein PR002_g15061 [Phytophthora rubi]|uniref:Uncharacterized protein n=1 Tax=Phytophthora rubi TaxID=129364 RepID=A0A6A3KVZ1_9STRA|nr:hypothetical protein PR002_g15061 [Phytophthora rubi]
MADYCSEGVTAHELASQTLYYAMERLAWFSLFDLVQK